ncbi:hypothetical protein CT19431_MP100044 [Cupriavidus taiwanensis]|nr:hypothetical protein CT19431_MP100044 [Cupriavidus taiwanensis]
MRKVRREGLKLGMDFLGDGARLRGKGSHPRASPKAGADTVQVFRERGRDVRPLQGMACRQSLRLRRG